MSDKRKTCPRCGWLERLQPCCGKCAGCCKCKSKRRETMSVAQDKLHGLECFWCGVWFNEKHGYPVACKSCWGEAIEVFTNNKLPVGSGNLDDAIFLETRIQKARFKELEEEEGEKKCIY